MKISHCRYLDLTAISYVDSQDNLFMVIITRERREKLIREMEDFLNSPMVKPNGPQRSFSGS